MRRRERLASTGRSAIALAVGLLGFGGLAGATIPAVIFTWFDAAAVVKAARGLTAEESALLEGQLSAIAAPPERCGGELPDGFECAVMQSALESVVAWPACRLLVREDEEGARAFLDAAGSDAIGARSNYGGAMAVGFAVEADDAGRWSLVSRYESRKRGGKTTTFRQLLPTAGPEACDSLLPRRPGP